MIYLIKGNYDSCVFFCYLEKNDFGFFDGSFKFYFYDVGVIVKFDY